MGMTLEQFVKRLADSGLIPAEDIVQLNQHISQGEAVKQAELLTCRLVSEHRLTEYQATVILRGDAASLILGNYIILDEIGDGGMGRVYKAWHRRMKRVVALKTLLPEMSQSTRALQRFHQEVATAAQLVHRNIVTAFDADEVQGVHFLVMEYVDGKDLAHIVRTHGPFQWRDAIRCILDAARGLDYAHQQGIIHRDIKPRNLLLDCKGTVKLLDLGLAQPNDLSSLPKAELTSAGVLVGTVDYLAPEQAMNVKQADRRSDIYSLGVSLFYICTGSLPFPGETVLERLVAHRETPVPPLAQFRPGAPKELETICQKMLAKDPSDRFASARELIVALENCLRDVFGDSSEGTPIRLPSEWDVINGDSSLEPTQTMRQGRGGRASRSRGAVMIGLGATLVIAILFSPHLIGFRGSPPADAEVHVSEPERPEPSPRERFTQAFPEPPEFATTFVDPADAQRRQQAWTQYLQIDPELTNSVGMRFELIPPGIAQIGSTDVQWMKLTEQSELKGLPRWYLDLLASEKPSHDAEIIFPYLLGVHEVTRAQYEAVLGRLPRSPDDSSVVRTNTNDNGTLPVGSVSWWDAIGFCNALSEREGLRPCYRVNGSNVSRIDGNGYRLPSEAEWEYACRAGTSTLWHFGDDPAQLADYCVFNRDVAAGPAPVGSRRPNPWGLYDMYGNVWEWCEDAFAPYAYESVSVDPPDISTRPATGRVVRGGSYSWSAAICRSSNRTYYTASYRGVTHGLRVARQIRTLPQPTQ